jgi:tRNA pseudouridine38-40 synthase
VVSYGDSGAGAVEPAAGVVPAAPRVWRLDLAYQGTDFHGWARQPGLRTVEGVLGDALAMILREPVLLSVAGRTDAGVHASAQVASFVCARQDLRPERLRHSLNAVLPPDVAVLQVSPASTGFVAREGRSRTYRYRLWFSPVKPVHERAYVWDVRGGVDTALLMEAAALLPGKRDFAALTPSARLYHSCVREVLEAVWRPVADRGAGSAGSRSGVGCGEAATAEGGPEWAFEISAGSFLHNMVRVAVGSMVDVAQGRMALEEFAEALAEGRRLRMGQTAPARGLSLIAVRY